MVNIKLSREDVLCPWTKLEMTPSNTYRAKQTMQINVVGWVPDTLEKGD